MMGAEGDDLETNCQFRPFREEGWARGNEGYIKDGRAEP